MIKQIARLLFFAVVLRLLDDAQIGTVDADLRFRVLLSQPHRDHLTRSLHLMGAAEGRPRAVAWRPREIPSRRSHRIEACGPMPSDRPACGALARQLFGPDLLLGARARPVRLPILFLLRGLRRAVRSGQETAAATAAVAPSTCTRARCRNACRSTERGSLIEEKLSACRPTIYRIRRRRSIVAPESTAANRA